jgi:hypothetical protein
MTTLHEAAQQALEALEAGPDVDPIFAGETEVALRAALEQPVQEPFGYIWPTGRHPEFRYTQQMRDGVAGMPLYTHPPRREWRSLSEEEVFHVENNVPDSVISDRQWTVYFASAIEAALRSKNHD